MVLSAVMITHMSNLGYHVIKICAQVLNAPMTRPQGVKTSTQEDSSSHQLHNLKEKNLCFAHIATNGDNILTLTKTLKSFSSSFKLSSFDTINQLGSLSPGYWKKNIQPCSCSYYKISTQPINMHSRQALPLQFFQS